MGLTTAQKRQQLADIVKGGDGNAIEGVIYEAEDAAHGGKYFYIVRDNGTRCICNTREQAQKLLDIATLGV